MNIYSRTSKLMGSAFELKVAAENELEANNFFDAGIAEIRRIEDLLSEFLPTSITALVNNNAGEKAIQTDEEFCRLVERCLKLSRLTKGYFDITVGPLKKIYRFKNDEFQLPDKALIDETLAKTGYSKVQVNATTQHVYLTQNGMRISFAAIGKGYAADCVKNLWIAQGVTAGCINASGDLTAFGLKPDGSDWTIGIANPDNTKEILFFLPVNDLSVATSGDYEQHFIYNGTRYSHTINPKTGLPMKGIKSVSVFSPSAELSDALATAVYTMGCKEGIAFVNDLPQTHAIIIDEQNKIYFSKNLEYEAVA